MITFTGVDERTKLIDLDGYSFSSAPRNMLLIPCEFAILYTANPEGRHRYPSREFIEQYADEFHGFKAIHICGQTARGQFRRGELDQLLLKFDRVQINGKLETEDHAKRNQFKDFIDFIAQSPGNAFIPPNFDVLCDASGGTGAPPAEWKRPTLQYNSKVGFAGGLRPGNIEREMPLIEAAAAGEPYWIDMETGVRTDDWFDIEKVKAVVSAVRQYTLTNVTEYSHVRRFFK